jgi:hypothetical protein
MTTSMADWTNFFIAEVGAAAALTGLVVVALTDEPHGVHYVTSTV